MHRPQRRILEAEGTTHAQVLKHAVFGLFEEIKRGQRGWKVVRKGTVVNMNLSKWVGARLHRLLWSRACEWSFDQQEAFERFLVGA